MSWHQNIIDALAPERQIEVRDERRFAAEGFVYRPAAVLIALTDRTDPGVILTQRPDWLRSHAGQVAFPGGKIDDSDSDVFAAALREAEEEIALPRDAVTILGEAYTYHSGSGYRISPVLGIIPPDLPTFPRHATENDGTPNVPTVFSTPHLIDRGPTTYFLNKS